MIVWFVKECTFGIWKSQIHFKSVNLTLKFGTYQEIFIFKLLSLYYIYKFNLVVKHFLFSISGLIILIKIKKAIFFKSPSVIFDVVDIYVE